MYSETVNGIIKTPKITEVFFRFFHPSFVLSFLSSVHWSASQLFVILKLPPDLSALGVSSLKERLFVSRLNKWSILVFIDLFMCMYALPILLFLIQHCWWTLASNLHQDSSFCIVSMLVTFHTLVVSITSRLELVPLHAVLTNPLIV